MAETCHCLPLNPLDKCFYIKHIADFIRAPEIQKHCHFLPGRVGRSMSLRDSNRLNSSRGRELDKRVVFAV